MATTRTPLRYPGGKSSLSAFLAQVLKLNQLHGATYIEPYAGGAGAALNLLFTGAVDRIVINDFDRTIYSFWDSIINRTQDFINRIISIPLTIEQWQQQKHILKTQSQHKSFDVGFAAFYLNRCNRSGILKAGPIGGMQQNSSYTLGARFHRQNLIKKIEKIAQHGKKISVYNMDAIDLLIQVVPTINGSKLVYLDPPYFRKGPQLYLNSYEKDDHENLAWVLKKTTSSYCWLLTYDDVQEIRDLYQDKSLLTYTLNYSAAQPKQGRELLISPPWIKLPKEIGPTFKWV